MWLCGPPPCRPGADGQPASRRQRHMTPTRMTVAMADMASSRHVCVDAACVGTSGRCWGGEPQLHANLFHHCTGEQLSPPSAVMAVPEPEAEERKIGTDGTQAGGDGALEPERCEDRAQVLHAVDPYFGANLKFASAELQAERELVLVAVQQYGPALRYAAEGLKNDHHLVITAVQQNGYALEHASRGLRGSRDIVLAAVAQDGQALQFASYELRADVDVVSVAVAQHGRALQYATTSLRANRDIVTSAVVGDPSAFEFVPDSLRGNRGFVLSLLQPPLSEAEEAMAEEDEAGRTEVGGDEMAITRSRAALVQPY